MLGRRTLKNAASAINTIKLLSRNKISRDNAVVSKRLVENTFQFSKSLRKNTLEELWKQDKDERKVSSNGDIDKLPPINSSNSILKAISDSKLSANR